MIIQAVALVFLTMAALDAQPKHEKDPVAEIFQGTPAAPILATAEQRMYRTRIRNGVANGAGVWTGNGGAMARQPGPNFARRFSSSVRVAARTVS